MKAIGGYFELELPYFKEYHSEAIALNSGRFCLEYILRTKQFSKVYVPYFTCDSTIEPLIKLGIPYEFYHIDNDYHIVDNITLHCNEALIYTNYWGLQTEYCEQLSIKFQQQLILDYTQAFFAKPIEGIDTFYSCRKFFGVPDGGYLYSGKTLNINIPKDVSYNRIDSLIKRIDLSAEDGYADFRKCSEEFHNLPMRQMSNFTKRMMSSINYSEIANKRRRNYQILQQNLGGKPLANEAVPMIFPYETDNGTELRQHLIKHKIFVAKYWQNVEKWVAENDIEFWLTNNILPLPIDQRYNDNDMLRIINLITP